MMKQLLLSQLRDIHLPIDQFREISDKLFNLLAIETSSFLDLDDIEIQTPLAKTIGKKIRYPITLVPILRSGLAMLPAFQRYFPGTNVGLIGMKRDEETAIPHLYYKNLPNISSECSVIVLDPMIATGGSGAEAIQQLLKEGIREEKIVFVGLIASQVGINKLKSTAPKMKLLVAQIDEGLNDSMFIVPGIGDFGDRFFGTPVAFKG